MSIMWIKNQAKWIIIAAAVLVAAGLILMDRPGAAGSGYQPGDVIGKVDGEEIPIPAFQQELKNFIRSEEMRSGRAPEGLQLAEMREQLFQFRVQAILLQKAFQQYRLHASIPEMQDYLVKHPLEVGQSLARFEGPDRVPAFLHDSTLDTLRYRSWIAQDSVYDRIGMRALEQQLKLSIIPQAQMQEILKSQVHRTDLEEAFRVEMREDLGRIRYWHAAADSFPVSPGKFPETELKAYFEAHPDSFHYREDAARLRYVRLPIQPSAADTALMREFALELKQRAEAGESFAELAKSYSNDPGSVDSGGRLGGFQPRATWVPEFAYAAFALEPGGVSDPVLTRFGFHIIQLHAKKKEDGTELADVSHILLRVTPGVETQDSLVGLAESLRARAEKTGLTEAAGKDITVETTRIFEKGRALPLGTEYLQGVQSFAFSPQEKKARVSEVLQNEEAVYLFEKEAHFPKGRNFERAREAIGAALARQETQKLAAAELEKVRAAQGSGAPVAAKAVLDSTGLIPVESYVPVFGFGSPELLRCFRQKPGEWGSVRPLTQGSIMAMLLESREADAETKKSKAAQAAREGDMQLVNEVFQIWVANLPKTAKVENHLDRVYRD